jgi:Delta7-sterol 5-desaturase
MNVVVEILKGIPQGIVTGLVVNGSLICLAYFLFWKKLKQRFQQWRIQINQRADAAQIKAEIKNSFKSLLVGAFYSSVVLYLNSIGYTKIYSNVSEYNIGFAILGFFVLLLIDDTWFYWCHRLLHHPRIFKYVHLEHHKSVDTTPFTSMSFHWLEPLLLSLWIIPVSFVFPIYAPVLGFLQLWGLLDNIKAHLGYELYPAWFNKSVLRFLTSSTHHNMHHSKFKGNYGVHFRFWDKLMGTEFKDYEKAFDGIQERKQSKPSPVT